MQKNDRTPNHDAPGNLVVLSSIEIHNYLERAIPEIKIMEEKILSSSSIASVLTEINQLSDGLDLINVYLNSLNSIGLELSADVSKLITNLSESVTSLHDFMQDGDARSMGASLTHELLPTLAEIQVLSFNLSQSK
ncbi:hypothetical protein MCEMIE11_01602 [Burkholderiales bacterium]